ncbi:TetR/AcrR family transcriptional regulator [Nocardiopsis sp. LOL_012]|uniref:TetR/AcrR family transcriptional regulator n=1 Tax=Nocardiopsis sp. LOL_012 TaxID=3345409 RepID=UPI003A879CDB
MPTLRSDTPRTTLLDTAERLFAEQGITAVSDRKVAEEAGQRNHSAVAYYFRNREGLLRALIERQTSSLDPERQALFEASDSLLDDVRSLVLPLTDDLASLPLPTYRARFLARAFHNPIASGLTRESVDVSPVARAIGASLLRRLDHLDPAIAKGRLTLMTQMVLHSCADVERMAESNNTAPPWRSVGLFLCDAIAGMLQAPSSQSSRYPDLD